MASTPAFGSMDPLGLFRQAGGKRPDRQPAPTPARQPDYDAASVIRDFEGFKDKPYWDVNALRAGYGSDTITSADGVVRRVAAGDVVSREDADRDLARRIDTEFVPSIVKEVGQDAWDALPGPTKAALSSVTYNYGNLPDSVAAAVKTGDGEAIAAAVEGLRGHNNGVNAKRRAKEAAMIRGGASAGADGAIVVDASYRPRDPMNLWRRPGGERRDDGMLEQGNIDLSSRPIRDNGDGTKSTVRSMSFGEDGVEVLIPTIGPDGRALTDDEAIARYHKTGEFLGKFASPEAATSFAEQLHEQQAEFLAQAESAGTKALFDKLDAESPGRYQVVDESELEGWQGDWKKKNASDGILGDTWRLLGMGQVGVEASMRELVRQIPYVGQHLVDAGDGIDKWVYGKASDDRYADLYAKDEATLTPEMRAARQKSWWDEDRGTLGDAWMDPRAYFAGVVESLPGTVATMAPAMFLARGAYLASLATGGTTKAAAAAAARTAMISGAVLEGGMGGADTARGVRAQIEAMPREQLLQTQAVQTLVDQGMTPDEAIAAVTNDAATQAFIVAGAATGMFGGFGDRMLAKIIGEGVEGTIGKRIAAGIGRGMVAEGLLEEAPQSAGGQLANNLALRNTVDPSQDLGEGVADAALGGAAVGAVMGGTLGGGGAAARPAQDGAVAEPAAPAPAPPAPPAPAPKKGPLVTALQAGVVASQQAGGVPDLSTLVAPEDLTPRGPDMVVEPPPDDAVTMVPVDIAGYPSPGATVRVEAEGIEPFTGKVDSYDQSDDGLEVVVISPDGQVLQVPTSAVKVPRVDQSVVAQLDAARNPPVDRSDVETDDATTRTVNGRTIVMPDEGLARLYDVGKERQISQRISGASGLQMRDAQVGQEKEVADLLGVLPDRIPEIADDYRYRVEKASRAKRDSDLPFQMHGLNADRLKGWKAERAAFEAEQTADPESTGALAQWWDQDLDAQGRRGLLDAAGVRRSEKQRWQSFSPVIRQKLIAARGSADTTAQAAVDTAMAPLEAAAAAAPASVEPTPAPELAGVDSLAHDAATSPHNDLPEPTAAQKEAGNYKMGHLSLGGLDISIENPAGSERSGTDKSGKPWSVTMKSHYGYVRGTVGRDKDHIDVFVRRGVDRLDDSSPVFVVDQVVDGEFDEHKVMLGYKEAAQAKRAYLANYAKGWKGLGAITETTLGEFKRWTAQGATTEPFASVHRPAEVPVVEPAAAARKSKREIDPAERRDDESGPQWAVRQLLGKWTSGLVQSSGMGKDLQGGAIYKVLDISPTGDTTLQVRGAPPMTISFRDLNDEVREGLRFTPVASDPQTLEPTSRAAPPSSATIKDIETGIGSYSFRGRWEPSDSSVPLAIAARDHLVEAGKKTGHEWVLAFGPDGQLLAHGEGKPRSVGFSKAASDALDTPDGGVVLHHNHPRSRPLSITDVLVLTNAGAAAIWAHGHDGTSSRASRIGDGLAAPEKRRKLYLWMKVAHAALLKVLEPLVKGGSVSLLDADTAVQDGIIRAMAAAGVLDYDTDIAVVSAIANTPKYSATIARMSEILRNEYKTDPVAADRRAGAERHPADLAGVPGRAPGAAERNDAAGSADRNGAVDDQGEAGREHVAPPPPPAPERASRLREGEDNDVPASVVELTGTELGVDFRGPEDMPTLRRAAMTWYDKNLRGTTALMSDGTPVRFSRKGMGKSTSAGKGDVLLRSIPAIKAIVEQGAVVHREPGNRDGVLERLVIAAPVSLAGTRYALAVSVHRTPNGHLQYDLTADRDAGARAGNETPGVPPGGAAPKGSLPSLDVPRLAVGKPDEPKSFDVAPGDINLVEWKLSDKAPTGWDTIDAPATDSIPDSERQKLAAIVQRVSGLSDVQWQERIDLPNGAPGWGKDAPSTAAGFYDPAADLIALAADSATERTAFHEAFHRLQRLFLTDQERAVLRQERPRLRRMVAGNEFRRDQVAGMSAKELEAEAFAIYATGAGAVKPHKLLRAAWDRIVTAVRRVVNWAASRGYQVSEDIFDRAVRGEIAGAPGDGTNSADASREFQAAPADSPGSRSQGLPAGTPVIGSWRNDRRIKAHPDYAAAKAGDVEAASRLVPDVVKPEDLEAASQAFGQDVSYLPVLAAEASGHNRIPALLAAFYAARTGAEVERGIVQANRAFHTGAGAAERLATRVRFDGPVVAGRRYVLVDDVTVMGSTLADLANHIRAGGGEVAGVVTLVNASRMPHMVATPAQLREISRRFGNAINDILGLDPESLTAPEASYLLGFRDAVSLRARIAKARLERGDRLRAKGLRADEDPAGEEDGVDRREYSLAAATPSPSPAEVRRNTVEHLKGSLTDLEPKVLAAVPLTYFSELARPNMSAVDSYLKTKRDMDAYRGRKHAAADEIAQEWLKLTRSASGILPSAKGKAVAAQLSDLMHQATLAGVDPSAIDEQSAAHPRYEALRHTFLALPAQAQAIFEKVRDSYLAQAAELDKLLLDAVRKAQEIAVKRADERYQAGIADLDRKLAAGTMNPLEHREAADKLTSAYANDKIRSTYANKARLTKMRYAFEASRVPAPYFPLARFGRYTVTVRDVDGTVISFSRREKAADRNRLAKDMRDAFPGRTVETGVMDEAGAGLRDAMDPRVIAEIEGILGGAGVDGQVIDQIWQRYLQSMPDLSTRKRFIHRKGTAGFDADALRAFSSHFFHAAHQMGRLKYGTDLQELLNQTALQARDADDPTKGTTLANELAKRHRWIMNPQGSSAVQAVTSFMFSWYLAASPAAALVNLTQTPMLGIPIIGARFGLAKTAAAMTKASADFVSGRGALERAGLSDEENRALEKFYDSGLVDRTQSHDLAGVGDTGVSYSPLRARVMAMISWAFHKAEVANREITALTAFRLARSAGQSFEGAVDTAHDLTWKTHFDYSNSSRPRLLQGDAAKLFLVFQNYQLNMWYRLMRDLHQTFKGQTPQARKEARTQLAGIMGMMTLMGGVTGFFGFNVLMAIAGMFAGAFADDDPFEMEQQMRTAVVDLFGRDIGGMILNGVPGHLLGIDLTSRIGMPDVFVRTPDDPNAEGRDWWQQMIVNALGVVPSTMINMGDGLALVRKGNLVRGAELMMPKALKDLMMAYRFANEGLTTRKGDEILPVDQVGAWSLVVKAMGFNPAKIAETYRRNAALYDADESIRDERSVLLNQYAMAVAVDDDSAKSAVLDRIRAFNAKPLHRGYRISRDSIQQSLRTRASNAAKREDGVLIQSKQGGADLRDRLGGRVYS